MRNKRYLIIVAVTMLGLASCGKVPEETNSEIVTQAEDIQDTDDGTTNGIANPWTVSDKQGLLEATGFNMDAPEGATDASYSYMADGKMAQLTYVYEGADWVYRIQPAEELTDISGMNYEWISESSGKVADLEAQYLGYSEQAEDSEYIDDMFFVQVVNWYDDAAGVTYSLSASGKDINGMDIGVYAENVYSPVND